LRMTFEAKKIEGPILTLAIQNRDSEMIKMLIQDLGAVKRLNQKIEGLKEHPARMTEEEMREEEIKTNLKLEEPKKILQQIDQVWLS